RPSGHGPRQLHPRPLVWQLHWMAQGAVFDFEAWLVGFLFSKEATNALERYCNRYDLRSIDVDDARQASYERLMSTSRRGAIADWVTEDDSARRYVLRALRNAVIDLGRPTWREDLIAPDDANLLGRLHDAALEAESEVVQLGLAQVGCESVR